MKFRGGVWETIQKPTWPPVTTNNWPELTELTRTTTHESGIDGRTDCLDWQHEQRHARRTGVWFTNNLKTEKQSKQPEIQPPQETRIKRKTKKIREILVYFYAPKRESAVPEKEGKGERKGQILTKRRVYKTAWSPEPHPRKKQQWEKQRAKVKKRTKTTIHSRSILQGCNSHISHAPKHYININHQWSWEQILYGQTCIFTKALGCIWMINKSMWVPVRYPTILAIYFQVTQDVQQ